MYCVIMFELEKNLTPMTQVNEVFGPFDSESEVDEWTKRATNLIKNREWLIMPFSNPTVLNALDPATN